MKEQIYFDNAATTPMDSDVIKLITKTMKEVYGNPSSTHQFGRIAKTKIEQARKDIAKLLHADSSEIIFTSGGSEADNLILINAVKNLGIKRIISTKIEHHAVLHTLDFLKKEFQTEITYLDINEYGEINTVQLENLVQDNIPTLVSLMYVNNELGNILDIQKIAEICKKNNVLFHSDTVQAIGHFTINLQKTPVDFITASAHKFHGPKGIGFAFIRKGFGIKPLLLGGAQEKGARAGTENVPNIVGMAFSLQKILQNLEKEKDYISDLKHYFIINLKNTFSNIKFNGLSADLNKSTYVITNVLFPKEMPMLLFQLDLKGIAVSGGSACQSGSNNGSHVLNEILSPKDLLKPSVRFSFSKNNTKDQIDYTIKILKELIK
ncbi:MAG TPA: cysteine desulfurase [Flavobacteriia bacterium]|nr:cysteine desulfurase [Flavobacteriia bacterium]